jgi:hypothetical protein
MCANRQLEWREVDESSVEVATHIGATRVAVRLGFDTSGDIVETFSEDRPRPESGNHLWGIGRESAYTIVPELQVLDVGDIVPDSKDGSFYFTVAAIEPERALVLHSTRHLLKPVRSIDFSWAFVLHPRADHRTRVFIRARVRYEPLWAWPLVELVGGVGDFVNAGQMLRGIKQRAEGASRSVGGSGS